MVSLGLAYIVLYVWQPGGVQVLELVTDMLALMFAAIAAILALRASRMFEPGVSARRVWLLFGVGMTIMTGAEALWTYYRNVLDLQTLTFTAADVLWAISYIPVLISLVLHYRTLDVRISRRRKIMVTAVYASALVIALVILFGSAFSKPGQISGLELLINAYYLIGDLSLAFIATLSLLFLWRGLVSKPWQYIVTSVLLLFIADLAISYGAANNLYATGSNVFSGFADVVYLSAYMVAVVGGYRQITLRLPQ
jgi:hypothetical protein